MTVNPVPRNPIAVLQEAKQLDKGLHLLRGRRGLIEVAHQAYSYSVFVGPVSPGAATVCSCFLIEPAECDLDLAVAAVCPVAYDKIVADSFPVVAFSMPLVEYGHIAVSCA